MNINKIICAFVLIGSCVTATAVLAANGNGPQNSLPNSVTGKTLADCVRKLDRQGGGWCSLGGNFFKTSVSPRKVSYYKSIRGWTGAKSIFIAWNGMAFDRKQDKLYLLANGGHADYLGDGVYEFNLTTGKWSRLRGPCPLTFEIKRGEKPPYGFIRWRPNAKRAYIPNPSCGPAAAHTYDGVQFSSKTRTIFWIAGIYGLQGGVGEFHSEGTLWEFNPSKSETRDGIKPLSWKRHNVKIPTWPTSVELPNGWLLYGANSSRAAMFDPANPEATLKKAPNLVADYGPGNLVLDKPRNTLWFLSGSHGILRIGLNGGHGQVAKTSVGFGMGAAVRKDKLVLWNGGDDISIFDPNTKKYRLINWAGKTPGIGNKRVYSKWVYLRKQDVFVGVSNGETGVVVYKMPKNIKGAVTSTVDPQKYINAAIAGSTVTIPAGVYKRGIYVNKPLTVDMAGARFMAPIQQKGVVVVNADGPVILNGLTVTTPPGCHVDCAGVRVEGKNYNVTIRNATILNQEMGVLTGNNGGRLVIEDSNLGETGPYRNQQLSHVIYAGWSDELIIRNSKIHGSRRLGHLVKSRAEHTVIENSEILGEHTRHSRLVDFPCGGHLKITNTVLQQSDMTDNPEFMQMGGGTVRNCAGHKNRPVYLTMRHDRLISYRGETQNAPAKNYGPTALMHYRGINAPKVNVKGGNIILEDNVNELDKWTNRPSIQVLWYITDGWGAPPPVAELKGR